MYASAARSSGRPLALKLTTTSALALSRAAGRVTCQRRSWSASATADVGREQSCVSLAQPTDTRRQSCGGSSSAKERRTVTAFGGADAPSLVSVTNLLPGVTDMSNMR